jgi:hypothetical protein
VTFGYWNSCRDIFMRDTIGSSTLRPKHCDPHHSPA